MVLRVTGLADNILVFISSNFFEKSGFRNFRKLILAHLSSGVLVFASVVTNPMVLSLSHPT